MSASFTDLTDASVRKALDKLDARGISGYLDADPFNDTHFTVAPGWSSGQGRPVFADDDPAVMQAIGRCAASRIRWRGELRTQSVIHAGRCGWCAIDVEELLEACSWSVWQSGHISSETLTWTGANGSHYTREGRHDVFTNLVHAEFWALPKGEREHRVLAVIAESREGMAA